MNGTVGGGIALQKVTETRVQSQPWKCAPFFARPRKGRKLRFSESRPSAESRRRKSVSKTVVPTGVPLSFWKRKWRKKTCRIATLQLFIVGSTGGYLLDSLPRSLRFGGLRAMVESVNHRPPESTAAWGGKPIRFAVSAVTVSCYCAETA